jgi:alpha-mannosidase
VRSEESNYTDQGEQEFTYALYPATVKDKTKIFRRGLALNTPPTIILENHHNGTLPLTLSGISVGKENILVSALKKSEDGKGYILRVYECEGTATNTVIDIYGLGKQEISFTPYEVKTLYIESGKDWEEVLFMEYKG